MTLLQKFIFFPMMNGFPLAWSIAASLHTHWLIYPFIVLISIALPAALVIVMLHASPWRPAILTVGFMVSCVLSTMAY